LHKNLEEKTFKTEYFYSGRIVKVRVDDVILPDGAKGKREIVEHPGAVAVVPVNDKKEVIFVKQFRKAAEKVLLEIPAGILEPGESPEECAQRELKEEIGYRGQSLIKLASFYTSPGFSSERLHLFLAQGLVKDSLKQPDDEFLNIEVIHLKEVIDNIGNNMLEDGKTITGIVMACRLLKV